MRNRLKSIGSAFLPKKKDELTEARPFVGKCLMVDVSVIAEVDARTGIQRVVRAIWSRLKCLDLPEFHVVPVRAVGNRGYFYADREFMERAQPLLGPSVRVVPKSGDIYLGLDLAAHILPRYLRLFSKWRGAGVKINLVVYDLLPAQEPRWFTRRSHRSFMRWLQFLSRLADGAICISSSVAEQLANWLSVNGGRHITDIKVSSIRLSGDIQATLPSNGLPANADRILGDMLATDAILMVGTIEPRKGYEQALDAFEALWQSGENRVPNLVVVGKAGWKTERLQQRMRAHPEHGHRFLWLENVSDEFLERLYRSATGVLLASHAEGCGLPLVEALAYKKPVLARDLPVFREIVHPALHYYEGDDPDILAQEIVKFISSVGSLHWEQHLSTMPSWHDTTHDLIAALGLPMSNVGSDHGDGPNKGGA